VRFLLGCEVPSAHASAHFAVEWGDHFAERFGHPTAAKDETRGKAA
jgi:hypothetical protein